MIGAAWGNYIVIWIGLAVVVILLWDAWVKYWKSK